MRLIIAEKPSVAGEIAKVVGATKREQGFLSGSEYLVSWCVGHLVSLSNPDVYGEQYKTWSLESLPILPGKFKTEVSKNTAAQFNVLKALMDRSDVSELIVATDAGREGELIFRLVYEKAGCKKPFKRLWISSMEEKSIQDGMANLKPGQDFDHLFQAAACRQKADWLVGMNLTRLYSKMYNNKLNVGRVQTPTVNLIVKRQREIENFVPVPYYVLTADLDSFQAKCRVDDKSQAEHILTTCRGKTATIASVDKKEQKERPPALYDLTSLQRDANRLLGYSAQQTLDYLQSLYDNKLSTYPRTDSRFLTADMEGSTIKLIEFLTQNDIYNHKITSDYNCNKTNVKQVINDKKVTDHHAILPTMNVTKEKMEALPAGEKNILILISYRLLSSTYDLYKYTSTKVCVDIEGTVFLSSGKEILDLGFKLIEDQVRVVLNSKEEDPQESDDSILPVIHKDDSYIVKDLSKEAKKTQPPKAYTEDTLLLAMETCGKNIEDDELKEVMKESGLGTPATRAGIIENIINTAYIVRDKKKLLPTQKAYTFIDLVTEKVKEPDLTAEWEKQLSLIQKGELSDQAFMNEIVSFIQSFVNETKSSFQPGSEEGIFKDEREVLGKCPKCGKDVVECKNTFSCTDKGCGFVIWKTIASKTITKSQVIKLLKNKKTDLIKGFKSKTGNSFDAHIVLKTDHTTAFEFAAKK